MMEQVISVPSQEFITKDNAIVGVDGVVFFQVLDAPKAAYEVQSLEFAIMQLTMTNLRTVMGSMDLDELLSQRDHLNSMLLSVVAQATTTRQSAVSGQTLSVRRDLVGRRIRQQHTRQYKQ